MVFRFPKNFSWGSATSAYQIEGGIYNNEWENAAGLAADHLRHWKEDINILKELNQNAYRFSMEWARIEPEEGRFDENAINFYKDLIKELKNNDIEPFLTCWHFTNPKWFIEKGGWQSKKAVFHFSDYIKKLVEVFGDDVKFWMIINEPLIYTIESFLLGYWPPYKINIFVANKIFKNLTSAFISASKIIQEANKNISIGCVENITAFHTSYFNLFFRPLIRLLVWLNERHIRHIKNYIDFIGLNYYFHSDFLSFFKKEKYQKSDMGWEIYPRGIYLVLKELKKYGKPIYVFENGLADAKDEKRKWFIGEMLKNILEAIQDGVDVRGYFHWSLMDNFEWDKGFWPRFGLVEVDYKTFERKIRPSARFYSEICKNNGIDI